MHEHQASELSACPADPHMSHGASAPRTTVGAVLREAVASRLFLMTTLAAATGQMSALAAGGLLARPEAVVTVGLTMVAGVGAFVAALEEATLRDAHGRRVFAATALLSIGVNVAAAGAGVALSHHASLEHLRVFAALALGAVAWEIASASTLRLPRGVPVPAALIALGVLVEVVV